MSIDYTLPVPLVNQLREPTMDGGADENKDDNCLFASCAFALMGLYPATTFDGDEIKDAVMGQGYQGFGYFCTALTTYLAAHGAAITVETGNLAATAHHTINAGVPLLAVIPSAWNTQPGAVSPNFATHVVLLAGVGSGWLRAMNPWGGFWHDNSDAWWQSRFCYGALWALIPKGGHAMGVPAGWHDDGTTLTALNGVKVVRGFRDHILAAASWDPALVPLAPEYAGTPGVRQDFGLMLTWDAAKNTITEVPSLPEPAPAPPDPIAAAALAAMQQFKAALGEV